MLLMVMWKCGHNIVLHDGEPITRRKFSSRDMETPLKVEVALHR